MNSERLFRILGWVDEDLIEEADTASSPAVSRRRPRWGRAILAGSACAAALWAAVVMLPNLSGLSESTGNSPEALPLQAKVQPAQMVRMAAQQQKKRQALTPTPGPSFRC